MPADENIGTDLRARHRATQPRRHHQSVAKPRPRLPPGHHRRRRTRTTRHRARRVRRNGQAHALPSRTRHGRSQRLMRKPSVQPRATPRACPRSGRCRPGRQSHAKSHETTRRSGDRATADLQKTARRHHGAGRHRGRPNRNTTENQPGTVRSCRRGPGRRARHRPQRSGRQRTRALRHHRHGQARRTRTQLRIRRGPHLRGGTGGRGHQRHDPQPCRHQNGHHPAARMPIRHHGRRRTYIVADRWRTAPRRQGRPARTQTRIARSLLRTVGGKLGIPSPAQGPPRGR